MRDYISYCKDVYKYCYFKFSELFCSWVKPFIFRFQYGLKAVNTVSFYYHKLLGRNTNHKMYFN